MLNNNSDITILVVDDDFNNRKFFYEFLKKEEFNVVECDSGEKAVELIENNNYGIVITDLQMYNVDGLDVLKAAKTKNPHTQVLILTGFGSIPTAVRAIKVGAYDYLSKPIMADDFLIRVKKASERHRMGLLLEENQKKINNFHAMIERDLSLAQRIQDSLVPQYYKDQDIEIGVKYQPMIGVGGDFADIYKDANDCVYLTIIDVTGHGIAAALLVNRVCSEIQKFVRDGLEPRQVLFHLNEFFVQNLTATGLFLTILSLKIDLPNKTLTYAGSAHPPGLLINRHKRTLTQLTSENLIIGFEASKPEKFTQSTNSLSKGDRIVLYTDGIVEAENSSEKAFGMKGLKKSLQHHFKLSVQDAAEQVVKDIQLYSQAELKDDVMMMITEIL